MRSIRLLWHFLPRGIVNISPIIHRKVLLDCAKNVTMVQRCNLWKGSSLSGSLPQPMESEPVPEEVKEPTEMKKLPLVTNTLSVFADQSPVLQKLIDLGVAIHKFDNDPELCKFIVGLDFDRDIKPYLEFLQKEGVPAAELGKYLTRNPNILKCDLDDLQVRINYLESKKFTKAMIRRIITKNPKWLSMQVKDLDRRLGYVQTSLSLTGDEVRKLATKFPGVALVKRDQLKLNLFTFKVEFGLEKYEYKKLVLKEPSLLRRDNNDLINTFHYLSHTMSIPVHLIIEQPRVLTCRTHILSVRHKFLLRLGRAQYNPKLPGYVSLLDLVQKKDEEFCKTVARTSLETFYDYQKTL